MTLTHLFKAQAVFLWLWVVMFWIAPQMAVQGPGWTLTPDMISFAQVTSVVLLALGIVSWNAPACCYPCAYTDAGKPFKKRFRR